MSGTARGAGFRVQAVFERLAQSVNATATERALQESDLMARRVSSKPAERPAIPRHNNDLFCVAAGGGRP